MARAGLDIEWNKRYESHTTLPDDDGVLVTFTDGTSATGSCLVGADGVNSGVRHNLFATAADPPELVTAPVNYIVGTRTLARHDYEQLLGLYPVREDPTAWQWAPTSVSSSPCAR